MPKLRDITGMRFGNLIALRYERPKWVCVCDCGTETTANANHLLQRKKKSCGCIRKSVIGGLHNHGMSGHRLAHVYEGMISRCYNPKHPAYARYGGRGIVVCERWLGHPENFIQDMGACPDGMTLDRINNDGNYDPNNCRWATRLQQGSNQRSNVFIEAFGQRQTIANWARQIGISSTALKARLKSGWSKQEAVSTPPRTRNGSNVQRKV